MKRTLWALLVCLSVGCGTTGDGGGGGGDDGDAGGGEDTAALCDSAAAEAVTEYQALDRSCTEDSDCEYRQIGGCGCPVPVNTGADDSAFLAASSDAEAACDEFYAAPGAQTCTNNLVCEFGGDGGGGPPVCTDGVCVDSGL